MMRGDILLIHSPGIISHMIRVVTQSWWNHAAWLISPTELIEAEKRGVRKNPVSKYKIADRRKVKVLRIKGIRPEDLDQAVAIAEKMVGMKYDYCLFFDLLRLYVLNLRRHVTAKDWRHALICSELIAQPLYYVTGFRFRDDVPVRNIVPADLDFSERTYEVRPTEARNAKS